MPPAGGPLPPEVSQAVAQVRGVNLDVRIVSRGAPSPAVRALVEELNA